MKPYEIVISEIRIALETWRKQLLDSLTPRGIGDFLPGTGPSAFPVPLPPIVLRQLDALSAIPGLLSAAVASALARIVIPLATESRKLNQRVVPLGRIATALGPPFLRSLLQFDRANAPASLPFSTLRKLVNGTFDLGKYVSSALVKRAGVLLAAVINALLLCGAVFAAAVFVGAIQSALEKIEDGVLSQSAGRKKVPLRKGGSIYRREPGGSKP